MANKYTWPDDTRTVVLDLSKTHTSEIVTEEQLETVQRHGVAGPRARCAQPHTTTRQTSSKDNKEDENKNTQRAPERD